MSVCDICNGRGVVYKDNNEPVKCFCVVKKELSAMLGDLVQYDLDKNINFENLKKHLNIIDGESSDYYSLVKSFLFKAYFNEGVSRNSYKNITGYNVVEYYLDSGMDSLIEVPYLFIDLTKYCNNKALGETVLYVIQQRKMLNRVAWTYIGGLRPDDIVNAYSSELLEHLMKTKTISLKR